MNRRWEFDALRGLMLVLMTVTHLPTRLSDPLGQPFGYVSAAEGFVLLSGFMAGLVYAGKQQRGGSATMRSAMWQRALTVYACHAALLVFGLTAVALVGVMTGQPAINNLLGYYRSEPLAAWLGGLMLVYAPPLLDILPMYVLFLLISPLLLRQGGKHGWAPVLAVSVALWFGAQFGLSRAIYEAVVALTGLPVPYNQTGAFDGLAWQFLWVLGLWLGADFAGRVSQPGARIAIPRWVVLTAWVVAVSGFAWRHGVGQLPLPGPDSLLPNLLFSKWVIGPGRMLNLFALLVLVLRYRDVLRRALPRLPMLERLGQASLPVFCAHLVVVLLALAIVGEFRPERPWWIDAVLLVVAFATLDAVARLSALADRFQRRWSATTAVHKA